MEEMIVKDLPENVDLNDKSDTSNIEEPDEQENVVINGRKRRFPRKSRKKTVYIKYAIPEELQNDARNGEKEEVGANGTDQIGVDSNITNENEESFSDKEKEEPITGELSTLVTPMLDRNSTSYDIHKFNKNIVFIFNQEKIDVYNAPRKGTQKDVDALNESFGSTIGFHVEEPYTDFTRVDILSKLEDISSSDFTDYGCLVIVFLTHGSSGGVLMARDGIFREREVLEFFKGTKADKSLLQKPKIFIFQACRGNEVSAAAFPGQSKKVIDHDTIPYVYTLPAESDFLVLHSTYEGNVSHRHTEHGTWFIQTLCKWIRDSPSDMEINVLLTRVKQEVAIDKENQVYDRVTQQNEINKQMPIYYTTLIRDLYLKKRPDEDIGLRTAGQKMSALDISNTNSYDTPQSNSKPEGLLLYRFKSSSELLSPVLNFRRQYFEYLRERLRVFVREHNMEEHAQHLINIADAVGPDDNSSVRVIADQTAREIAIFLKKHAGNWIDIRSIFFYEE